MVGLFPPPLLQRLLSRGALILSTSAMALSPCGLSFSSDGESLRAISSVGAEATLVCGSGVPTTSAAVTWVLSFLPVKSLV